MKTILVIARVINGLKRLGATAAPVSALELSEKIHYSTSTVEKVLTELKAASLVLPVRGPGGGYLLLKTDTKIGDLLHFRMLKMKTELLPLYSAMAKVKVSALDTGVAK
ncbi:TPA: Rrf2 family transcriptional regulator [Escherichia coli]